MENQDEKRTECIGDGLVPMRLFGRVVSKGERMKLQPDKQLGGCWMIRTEFVRKLVDGSISEIYFTWVPDRAGWKRQDSP